MDLLATTSTMTLDSNTVYIAISSLCVAVCAVSGVLWKFATQTVDELRKSNTGLRKSVDSLSKSSLGQGKEISTLQEKVRTLSIGCGMNGCKWVKK